MQIAPMSVGNVLAANGNFLLSVRKQEDIDEPTIDEDTLATKRAIAKVLDEVDVTSLKLIAEKWFKMNIE